MIQPSPRRPYRGLLKRRTLVVPTWRGWLLLAALFVVAANLVLRSTYPFLAVSDEKPAGVLVVEGWNSDSAFKMAIEAFHRNGCRKILVTGGPMDKGAPLSEYKTYAELGATILVGLGMKPEEVEAVPAPAVRRDRTYTSAVALAKRLAKEPQPIASFNLISVGPHCRRSRMLFEKALGDSVQIGVIPAAPDDYDPSRWWRSSQGFRTVSGECIAYVYARLFFNPSEEL